MASIDTTRHWAANEAHSGRGYPPWRRSRHRPPSLMSYLSSRHRRAYRNVDVAELARNHGPFMERMNFMKKLPVHEGCVNTIQWNKTGEYLLSGSDDCNLCITRPNYMFDSSQDYTVLHKVPTRHLGNIFSARFVPNSGDQQLVSCSSEGPVIVHDICSADPSEALLTFNCHSSTIYEVVTVPEEEKLFLTCSEDKTVRLFDMRVHSSCARSGTCPHPALIRNSHAMTTLSLHPANSNLLLVGRADGLGLVYDRRRLPDVTKFSRERAHAERLAARGTPQEPYKFRHPLEGVVAQFAVPDMEERYRFTSLCYNKDGTEVLASYSGDYLYLFSHDRASNLELVQTLAPKAATNGGSSNSTTTSTSDRASTRAAAAPRDQLSARDLSSSARSARISRIRVRGDWSDTGVHSVPYSRRAQREHQEEAQETAAGVAPSAAADQIAVTLGNRRLGTGRSHFIPLGELMATGPPHESRVRAPQGTRAERTIDEEEEDDTSENSTVIDEWESAAEDGEDEDEEEEEEDDDSEARDRLEFERFAELTAENLIEEAQQEQRRQAEREQQQQERASSTTSSSPARTASEARAKFRRTLDNLKSKFEHIPAHAPRAKYQGHRNSRTSIKEAIFWGDAYVMSGSDCGRIMVWHKETARLVMAFTADERVVNCLAPNPHHYALASSGIDYDIKLWSTQSAREGPLRVSAQEMSKIVENNEMMLEESKHTISVPPHLFFRVLASLVQSSR